MDKELSKEEIIKKAHANRFKHKYSDEWIADAMQEYADQQAKKKAIAFDHWCDKYFGMYLSKKYSYDELYESEEFKKYFEQRNKSNMNTIPTKEENPKGLHQRYFIQKYVSKKDSENYLFGEPVYKPVDDNAEYFVLRLDWNGDDPKHIAACRQAVLRYAELIEEHLPKLAKDLIERYSDSTGQQNKEK